MDTNSIDLFATESEGSPTDMRVETLNDQAAPSGTFGTVGSIGSASSSSKGSLSSAGCISG